MATWHLTMKLFPAKCHERATLRKLWRQTGNSSLLPAKCWPLLHMIRGGLMLLLESWRVFQNFLFCFVLLYNKSLNDWCLGEQWILFPSNLNVSLDFPRDQSLSVNCYIARLSLNNISTVIRCFLVTCPWSNSNVSRPGCNCAVVAHTPSLFVCFCYMI